MNIITNGMQQITLAGDCASNGKKILSGTISNCMLSEIVSPTRFYIQELNDSRWPLLYQMDEIYRHKIHVENSKEFDLLPEDLAKGCRIVVRFDQQYDRAEVISGKFTKEQTLKVFFIDYGTVGYVNFTRCKKITDIYAQIPKLCYRAGLHGIEPAPGKKLWPISTNFRFVEKLKDRELTVEIVAYHQAGDFYEVQLFIKGVNIGDNITEQGAAMKVLFANPSCIMYPPFEFMEQTDFYPTLAEREYLLKKNLDFNEFEETNVDSLYVKDEETLMQLFKAKFREPQYSPLFAEFKFLLNGYFAFPKD